MSTIPVLAGLAVEMFFDSKKKILSHCNIGRILSMGTIALFTVFGLRMLKSLQGDIEADYTGFYSHFANVEKWSGNSFQFPGHFLTLIGFTDDAAIITEKEGIFNLIAIAVFVLLMIVPLVSVLFWNKIRKKETKIILTAYLTLLAAILLIFICGNISNANWRLVPLVGVSGIATFAVVNELLLAYKEKASEAVVDKTDSPPSMSVRIASVILIVFLAFSYINYKEIKDIPEGFGMDNSLHVLTNLLIENELEYGFATFWRSQAITLLSDSKVKCREILATAKDGAKTDYYQSSYDWYDPQEGVEKYFVLLSDGELRDVSQNETWNRWVSTQLIEQIDAGAYQIFVFEGYPEGIK